MLTLARGCVASRAGQSGLTKGRQDGGPVGAIPNKVKEPLRVSEIAELQRVLSGMRRIVGSAHAAMASSFWRRMTICNASSGNDRWSLSAWAAGRGHPILLISSGPVRITAWSSHAPASHAAGLLLLLRFDDLDVCGQLVITDLRNGSTVSFEPPAKCHGPAVSALRGRSRGPDPVLRRLGGRSHSEAGRSVARRVRGGCFGSANSS